MERNGFGFYKQQLLWEKASAIQSYCFKEALLVQRNLWPMNVTFVMFVPAAKLVCIADTGLALSLSRSVTSGEAKPTKPLYTL